MANYGKIKLRNLDEDVISLLNTFTKSGEIKLSDLSKELRDKINSIDFITEHEDTIYINYNDEQLKEAIQEAINGVKEDLQNYRTNDDKITQEDLSESLKEAIENAGNHNNDNSESNSVSQETLNQILTEFADVKDEVKKLEDAGPTRGIVKYLFIANTLEEEENYKEAKLSPIYKPSTGKVYTLTLKTEESEYSDPEEENTGTEYYDSATDTSSLDDEVTEIDNSEAVARHFFTGNAEPENASIGDIWIDTSENTNNINPDNDVFDEWTISGSEWAEVPGGLLDRNFARSLIYEPIKRKIYYCALGKLIPIRISSDDETRDITLTMNSSATIEISNAYTKNIRVLILNDDKNLLEYNTYSPAKETECQLYLARSSVKIKNLTNKTIHLKIVY